MRRRPFSNWHSTYSRIYSAILKIHLAAKSEKKQEKEEKRKHDSGKLSDGDKIDLIIIWQTNVFVINSNVFSLIIC